jgi:diguanylate cyclase (GGDEF)-like protein
LSPICAAPHPSLHGNSARNAGEKAAVSAVSHPTLTEASGAFYGRHRTDVTTELHMSCASPRWTGRSLPVGGKLFTHPAFFVYSLQMRRSIRDVERRLVGGPACEVSGSAMEGILELIRKRPFQSLASRVIFFVFLATLLTSLVVTWVSTQSIHGFLRDKLDQKFPAVLSGSAERLDIWYGQRRLDMATFARAALLGSSVAEMGRGSTSAQRESARRVLAEYLGYVLERFPQYEALFILDNQGREVFGIGDRPKLPRTLLARLKQVATPQASDIYSVAGHRLQLASAGIKDRHDQPIGSLHAVLHFESVDELLQTERLGEQGVVMLVGRDGTIHTRVEGRDHGTSYDRPLPELGEPARVSDYVNAGGDTVVGSAVRLRHFGWSLVVEEPYRDAFQPSFAAVRRVLLINLATVLIFSLIAFRIALSIVRPVQALSQGARRIADGETDVVILETSSYDELGLLTRTFNRMAARLHRNRLELQENRLNIEAANVRLRGQNEELQRMNEALEQLSITDGLTKLYNHRFFQENLTREIARVGRSGATLTLILIDIDNFKQLNDRYGHAAGDQVLCEVARIMSGIVRESDVLARYGGEEFALVPNQTSLNGAVGLAEKIRMAIAEHDFLVDDDGTQTATRVTVSVGVAAYREDRKTFFNDADRALYRAKAAGKDCVVVETGERALGDDEDL